MRKAVVWWWGGALAMVIVCAIKVYPGIAIRVRMVELYRTVDAIQKAENAYYAAHGAYALIPYSLQRAEQERFFRELGVRVPDERGTFMYGVYYDPAEIYVRVRAHPGDPSEGGWWVLCHIPLAGPAKGKWFVAAFNPWSKYLVTPGEKIIDDRFVK